MIKKNTHSQISTQTRVILQQEPIAKTFKHVKKKRLQKSLSIALLCNVLLTPMAYSHTTESILLAQANSNQVASDSEPNSQPTPQATTTSEVEDLLQKAETNSRELKNLSSGELIEAITQIASVNHWTEENRARAEKTLAILYASPAAQLSPELIAETKRLSSSAIKRAFRSSSMQKIYRKARAGEEISNTELEQFLQSYKSLLEGVFRLPSGPLTIVDTNEPFDMRYLLDKDTIEVNLGSGSSCNGQGPKKAKDEYNRRSLWLSCLFFAELHEMIHRWVVKEIATPTPFNGRFATDAALFKANLHNIDYDNPRKRGAYLLGDQSKSGAEFNRLNPLEAQIVTGMNPYVKQLANEIAVNPVSIPQVFIAKGTRDLNGLKKYRKKFPFNR